MTRRRSRNEAASVAQRLAASQLSKRFGGILAIDDVSFELTRGDILGVIGPNGSGKTTLVNLLTGGYRPDRGSVTVDGAEIAGLAAHKIAALGVARTFQNPHVFRSLTVRQNMLICVQHLGQMLDTRQVHEDMELWLANLGLSAYADHVAQHLSGGQQKLVEFARAMVRRPKVVLMDEPFAGVHPEVKKVLHAQIRELAHAGTTSFLIVSHEIADLVRLSNTFLCMANGKMLLSGPPAAVCADQRVIEAYLGTPLEGVT